MNTKSQGAKEWMQSYVYKEEPHTAELTQISVQPYSSPPGAFQTLASNVSKMMSYSGISPTTFLTGLSSYTTAVFLNRKKGKDPVKIKKKKKKGNQEVEVFVETLVPDQTPILNQPVSSNNFSFNRNAKIFKHNHKNFMGNNLASIDTQSYDSSAQPNQLVDFSADELNNDNKNFSETESSDHKLANFLLYQIETTESTKTADKIEKKRIQVIEQKVGKKADNIYTDEIHRFINHKPVKQIHEIYEPRVKEIHKFMMEPQYKIKAKGSKKREYKNFF